MSPKAGESYLFRQDDVYWVLRLFLARPAALSQQVFPLLPDELAVLGISQPRLAAAKKHDSRGAQDDQAGEQGEHAEANELPVGDEDAGGVHRLLQGDLEQVPVRRPEKLVEGVSREGVVLRSQGKHSVVHRPGTDRLGPGFGPVLQGTCGTCKPLLANAPECSIRLTNTHAPVGAGPAGAGREAAGVITSETGEAVRTDACEGQAVARAVASVEAGVRLAAVNADLAEVSRKPRRTQTCRVRRWAVLIRARASVLTRRAGGQSSTMLICCRGT